MKSLRSALYILSAITLLSCKQLKISENESKAINEIAGLYGGQCSYAIKLTNSTKYGKYKTFEIEISNSDFINQNNKLSEMYASNIAYTFFTFVRSEINIYKSILCTIVFKEGGKATFAYNTELLQLVDAKLNYVNKIVDILKRRGYDEIRQSITTGPVMLEENREKYITKLKSMDSTFGNITGFTMYGFRINSEDERHPILHISGALKRSKLDSQFSIDINAEYEPDEFYYIDYYY